jgi:hypothetical protein
MVDNSLAKYYITLSQFDPVHNFKTYASKTFSSVNIKCRSSHFCSCTCKYTYSREHAAAFMNLRQIVILIVLSNTTTFFYSGMATGFGLKRPSSGHHYKNFKIRNNTVHIVHKLHWSWWPDDGLFRPKHVVIPE